MDLNIQKYIPEDFPAQSRVWVYQSSRLFTMGEAFEIETILEDFLSSWNAHGAPVKGYANLLFGQFVILMADEDKTAVSGCSTDTSVRMIKNIEEQFKVNMFDRQTLAFIIKEKIQLLPLSQLNYAVENNFVNADTLYFNNTVLTKEELLNKWIIPVKESWLAKKLPVMNAK
ncbi:MAG: hypothetical protein JWN76_184 [Chitinophagaceae bacterium]|nr:hypothetical protein [Chitinophagaceae bacterium]